MNLVFGYQYNKTTGTADENVYDYPAWDQNEEAVHLTEEISTSAAINPGEPMIWQNCTFDPVTREHYGSIFLSWNTVQPIIWIRKPKFTFWTIPTTK